MIYTSAIYATADESMVTGTSAGGETETVPADYKIFRCPDDGPAGFLANGGTIAPYVAPAPPAKTRLYKSTLIRRMTPDEAASFESMLQAEMPWLRMLYHSVEYFDMADALVGYMHLVIAADVAEAAVADGAEAVDAEAIGEARATELLAPEA